MKTLKLVAGFGLLALGSGTAFAQAGPGAPGPQGPNAGAVASGDRENSQGFTHVMNNIDRGKHTVAGTAVTRATAADITVGAAIRDVNGQPIGKVASVEADGIVVDSGQAKVKVPLAAFGKDKAGLLIGISAQKFASLVAQAHAQAAASTPPAKPEPRPATAAEVVKGAAVRDVDGKPIGSIEYVGNDGATVDLPTTKVKLPLDVFGVDASGLVIGISLQKLNELIAQSHSPHPDQAQQ